MKTLLRTMPLLVVLCVAVFVFPNQALAATEITIGGTNYTWANIAKNPLPPNSGLSWTDGGNTLTFSGVNLVDEVNIVGDVRIHLIGSSNSITANGGLPLSAAGNITFTGSGALTLTGDAGISATNITVNGGTLNIVGTDWGRSGIELLGGAVTINGGRMFVEGGIGIDGNLVINGGEGSAEGTNTASGAKSVSGTITNQGVVLSSNPNPYVFKVNQQQQQEQQQQQVSREGVVFAMDRDLSYPNGLVFAFHGGYFANFEGVWIHGYAVPEAAYSVDVHNGIAYVFLNRDYLYYALNLAPNEEHLLHVVFSNGYGVTNFTFN